MATKAVRLADRLAAHLHKAIKDLPENFFDSFDWTCTGQNFTHPIVLGILSQFVWNLKGVTHVGIDVRLNNRQGVKCQPDVVGFDKGFRPVVFIDYESPNSSDSRIVSKDIHEYVRWGNGNSGTPYIVITTLPKKPKAWQTRWLGKGEYNYRFRKMLEEWIKNPFRFWYGHYKERLKGSPLANVAGVPSLRHPPNRRLG